MKAKKIQVIEEAKKSKNIDTNDKFLKLVEEHFADDNKFNLKKYINTFHNEDNYESSQIDKLPICLVLPRTKFIAADDILNITYQGKECSAKCTRFYKYKKYYIIHEINSEGDELEVLKIDYCYGNLLDAYKSVYV